MQMTTIVAVCYQSPYKTPIMRTITENNNYSLMSDKREYRPLRDAFGQFATGVTVVTARNEQGMPIGITANSFASVSLEPPLVSWCVDRESTRFPELSAAEFYTISVLGEHQQALSNLFASRSWDDTVFDEINWSAGLNNVPQLEEVSARFHCRLVQRHPAGDHVILVGEVLEFENAPQAPLLFFQGDYCILK
jgi:flavin reductase (DIM6/NTAB) family NADH-FMN oxidoreductase RutF